MKRALIALSGAALCAGAAQSQERPKPLQEDPYVCQAIGCAEAPSPGRLRYADRYPAERRGDGSPFDRAYYPPPYGYTWGSANGYGYGYAYYPPRYDPRRDYPVRRNGGR